MLKENTEYSEAYQRLNITMPNEKVDEMDQERGNVPRSTYLTGLIGQRENPRGKTVVPPKYAPFYLQRGPLWLHELLYRKKNRDRDLDEIKEMDKILGGAVALSSRQLSSLTHKILESAKECRIKIEDISEWVKLYERDGEDGPEICECSRRLRLFAAYMDDLRGCIIHLRALGTVDEHVIDDLEETYNDGLLRQGWLIDYVTCRACQDPPLSNIAVNKGH